MRGRDVLRWSSGYCLQFLDSNSEVQSSSHLFSLFLMTPAESAGSYSLNINMFLILRYFLRYNQWNDPQADTLILLKCPHYFWNTFWFSAISKIIMNFLFFFFPPALYSAISPWNSWSFQWRIAFINQDLETYFLYIYSPLWVRARKAGIYVHYQCSSNLQLCLHFYSSAFWVYMIHF